MTKKIRNIAFFAHVDAGKTSVSEQILYHTGKIKKVGSVDKGNAQTDFLEVEKQRGITVNSTIMSLYWKDVLFNIIDTPGHIDFSSETEKAIVAIDGAVVIISAIEGVQAQTENLIELLKKHQKPFLIFINKIDRLGADIDKVIEELEIDLNTQSYLLQHANQIGSDSVTIHNIWGKENYKDNIPLLERIIESDEDLLESYFEGHSPNWEVVHSIAKEKINSLEFALVIVGSAKLNLGIPELLDAIIDWLPSPTHLSNELMGIVFKTYHEKGVGKLSAVRLFGGTLESRAIVKNASKNIDEKISIIKNTDLQQQAVISSFSSGEMAWVQGLINSEPGDCLGIEFNKWEAEVKNKALLTVQIIPEKESDINALIEAIQMLNNEDPGLQFEYIKDERELHINIRGEIQKEVLQSVLQNRFELGVHFSEPTVIYKETPTITCEGYVRYWMPKPCWAIMKFKIEPGKRGSGVQYHSLVGVNDIKKQYQNDVEKTIPIALKQGILGWEVDDIKITLIEGEDHESHTKSNDFAIATPMGIMDGLSHSESTLLEPILSFKIIAPEESLGLIVSELLKLRAVFDSPSIENLKCRITGNIPLATSIDFPIKLSSITSGKGKMSSKFSHYEACENSLGKTRAYKGISPLDTSKYILKARKALS